MVALKQVRGPGLALSLVFKSGFGLVWSDAYLVVGWKPIRRRRCW